MIEIPIVAVHSTQNYSWGLCLKVAAQDAILFYSTKPLENEQNVERERFLGEYHVPHDKATGLYHALRETHPVQDIAAHLKLEKIDPDAVFRKLVAKKQQESSYRSPLPQFNRSVRSDDLYLRSLEREAQLTGAVLNRMEQERAARSYPQPPRYLSPDPQEQVAEWNNRIRRIHEKDDLLYDRLEDEPFLREE